MLLSIDHLILAVQDLDAAAAELERTVGLAAAGFVEWLVVGLVIGLVYKPTIPASRRATGV